MYTDISAIISHPQVPQKITILFHAGPPGLYELTVNVPTYTKSSRIYNNLVEIRRGIESEELEQPQPLQLAKGGKTAGATGTATGPGGGAQGKRGPGKQPGAQN
jgi:hypothetical protein